MKLLIDQSNRYRTILVRLTHRSESEGDHPFYRLPLMTLIETIVGPQRREGVVIDAATDAASERGARRAIYDLIQRYQCRAGTQQEQLATRH